MEDIVRDLSLRVATLEEDHEKFRDSIREELRILRKEQQEVNRVLVNLETQVEDLQAQVEGQTEAVEQAKVSAVSHVKALESKMQVGLSKIAFYCDHLEQNRTVHKTLKGADRPWKKSKTRLARELLSSLQFFADENIDPMVPAFRVTPNLFLIDLEHPAVVRLFPVGMDSEAVRNLFKEKRMFRRFTRKYAEELGLTPEKAAQLTLLRRVGG